MKEGRLAPPEARSQSGTSSAREDADDDVLLLRLETTFWTDLLKLRAFSLGSRSWRVAMKNSPQNTISSSVKNPEDGGGTITVNFFKA